MDTETEDFISNSCGRFGAFIGILIATCLILIGTTENKLNQFLIFLAFTFGGHIIFATLGPITLLWLSEIVTYFQKLFR